MKRDTRPMGAGGAPETVEFVDIGWGVSTRPAFGPAGPPAMKIVAEVANQELANPAHFEELAKY